MSRRDEAGFTLLEILVALVILGLLLGTLAQGSRFGIRAWNTQSANVSRNAALDIADRTLRTLLTRMQPPAAADQPSLVGAGNTLQFISALPEGAPLPAPRLAAIALLVDGHRLILRWTPQPHAHLLGTPPPSHDDVLLEGVDRMEVSYRGRDGAWNPTWNTAALPQLIRLHLVLIGTHRHWPDMLVAPMRDSISESDD